MMFYEERANAQAYVPGTLSITFGGIPVTGVVPTSGTPMAIDLSSADYTAFGGSAPVVRNGVLVVTYDLITTDASLPQCSDSYTFYDCRTLTRVQTLPLGRVTASSAVWRQSPPGTP
jgi:hypothetical protein